MSITISTLDNDQYKVNDHILFKDMDGNWVSNTELTPAEERAFKNYIEAQTSNK